MKKQEPVLDWQGIVAELHRRGMTLGGLAEMHDLNPSSFRNVKARKHYKAQRAIADFIGHKPEDLWPSRYPEDKPRILSAENAALIARAKMQREADKRDAA